LDAQVQVADAGDEQVFVQDGFAPFFVDSVKRFSEGGVAFCQPK